MALVGGFGSISFATDRRALIDQVAETAGRLAALGWRQLLLEVTGGELDLEAVDLASELSKPLNRIDRAYPGFGDFAAKGQRGIEPEKPAYSLLYHAFASPTVVGMRDGTELQGFPTPSEVEAVENYVYGVKPPTLGMLHDLAGGRPLSIVVFALQYRNAPGSVHGRHAELCFSRTGIVRLGTIAPFYDARRRSFISLDAKRPFDFRVVPQRFAAYIAFQATGDRQSFGPQDFADGDDGLQFWVPLHKIFSGGECLAGLDLAVDLSTGLVNDKLQKFHRYMEIIGYPGGWSGDDLRNFPFVIRNEQLGGLSQQDELGSGVLEPRAQPLAIPATYRGKRLSFKVDGDFTSEPDNLEYSSMQMLGGPGPGEPTYVDDAAQDTQRDSPEYINIRHRVLPDGGIDDLNRDPDMMETIRAGGYRAEHYVDFTGDGWVAARCPQLETAVPKNVPAFCLVAPPDFFPLVNQRELMLWWRTEVPEAVRAGLWAIPPLALSHGRIAADITLPIGFSINDTTVTAIVSQPTEADEPVQVANGPMDAEFSGLPDTAAGMFDPGWDASQGIYFTDPEEPLQKFLQSYGLGSPFVEDAKLCAALGSYWPAVCPDATRTFPPDKVLGGVSYPWPTIVPLTDEEIGIEPTAEGNYMPWDGVRGPQARTLGDRRVAVYQNPLRADYLDIMGTMTAALTARIDQAEYQARILSMAAVYWSLGIHDADFLTGKSPEGDPNRGLHRVLRAKAAWAVLSFRIATGEDQELGEAESAAGHRLEGPWRFRFHVYRWGEQRPDPDDIQTVLVDMLEEVIVYTGGGVTLIRRDSGPWTADRSIPT
jgi:hypothetical protein